MTNNNSFPAKPGYAAVCLALGTVFSFPTLAQTENASMEEVITWGTQVRSSSVYLGESDISIRQADHLSDLLRVIPGVDIGGTHSINNRINFRGLDDRDLSVFIDGALQTNYLYHHVGNLLINADILKSADIQLGANSVVHGGLGGSIRFETKDAKELLRPDQQLGGRVMASYHDNAKTSYSATLYGQLGKQVDGLVYFNRDDRDNFEDGDGVDTIGSDGETDNLLLKLGVDITDSQRLEVSYESIMDEGDYTQRPDMGVRTNSVLTPGILLPTEYERESINVGYEVNLGEMLDLRVTYYTNDLKLQRDETATITRTGPGTLKSAESDNQGLNLFAMSSLTQGSIAHHLVYGLEYFDQDLQYNANLADASTPIVRQDAQSLALFVEDQIEFANGIRITPGIRYNNYEQNLESTGSSDDWSEVTFGLAGEVPVTEDFRLLASYTTLFKGPELAEPFVGGSARQTINPDLSPETGQNIEIGARYSHTFANNSMLNFGVNVFQQTIDDYIAQEQPVAGSMTEVQDRNVGEAVIDGFEASLNYVNGPWDLLLTYSRSELDDDDLDIDDTTESLRELGDTLGLEIRYELPNPDISLNYNAQFVFEQDLDGGNSKPSYNVHNISAQWRDMGGLQGLVGTLGVDNLFDETYTSHASRTGVIVPVFLGIFDEVLLDDIEPGRNIKVSIAYSF